MSVRLIKLCASSKTKPLHLLFRNSLETKTFPNKWEKPNMIPVHKNRNEQSISNYRPASFLPSCCFLKSPYKNCFRLTLQSLK